MKKKLFSIISGFIGVVVGGVIVGKTMNEDVMQQQRDIDKFRAYYNILNRWLEKKQQGESLEKVFNQNNYRSIAIYGMGGLGGRLYDDLKNTDIQIKYVIDQNASGNVHGINVVKIDEPLEIVDVIIVTAISYYDQIEKELRKRTVIPIVSLEKIIYTI